MKIKSLIRQISGILVLLGLTIMIGCSDSSEEDKQLSDLMELINFQQQQIQGLGTRLDLLEPTEKEILKQLGILETKLSSHEKLQDNVLNQHKEIGGLNDRINKLEKNTTLDELINVVLEQTTQIGKLENRINDIENNTLDELLNTIIIMENRIEQVSKKPDTSNLVEVVTQQTEEINDLQNQIRELEDIADINNLVDAIEEQGLILTNLEARIKTMERGKSVAITPIKEGEVEEIAPFVKEKDMVFIRA